MTNQPTGSYRTCALAFTVLALLVGISFIPPIQAGNFTIHRANIFSALHSFETKHVEQVLPPEVDVEDFEVNLEQVAEQVAEVIQASEPTAEQTSLTWEGASMQEPMPVEKSVVTAQDLDNVEFESLIPASDKIVKIEDFAQANQSALKAFYNKLLTGESVHIGFMGDSFIEGDILTCDLRSLLQGTFGGGGVGYVPYASPLTKYRATIKTTSSGWTPYNILLQKGGTPEPYINDYFISGWVAGARDGATTRWDMTTFREHADECNCARLLFVAREPVKLLVTLNEVAERTFSFEAGEQVRQVVVQSNEISSLEVKIVEGASGFSGIGVEFYNEQGVSLDNFSTRSDNGKSMFRTNPVINAQINQMHPYDLIIVQYGLNILTAERKDYSLYAEQIVKMVQYLQECFPTSAIMVMSVSARSLKHDDGHFEVVASAANLAEAQREAAQKSGVAFWSTYDAMQRLGGIDVFVENGWISKNDRTHIGYSGGARVARELFHAMLWDLQQYKQQLQREMELREPVIQQHIQSIPPQNDSLYPLPEAQVPTDVE